MFRNLSSVLGVRTDASGGRRLVPVELADV